MYQGRGSLAHLGFPLYFPWLWVFRQRKHGEAGVADELISTELGKLAAVAGATGVMADLSACND